VDTRSFVLRDCEMNVKTTRSGNYRISNTNINITLASSILVFFLQKPRETRSYVEENVRTCEQILDP